MQPGRDARLIDDVRAPRRSAGDHIICKLQGTCTPSSAGGKSRQTGIRAPKFGAGSSPMAHAVRRGSLAGVVPYERGLPPDLAAAYLARLGLDAGALRAMAPRAALDAVTPAHVHRTAYCVL